MMHESSSKNLMRMPKILATQSLKRFLINSSVPADSKTPNEATLEILVDRRILQDSSIDAYNKLVYALTGSFVL